MAPVEFPEDVWERIKAFRPRCSPTAMCIKRYMAAHAHLDGWAFLPISGRCRFCQWRCKAVLTTDGEIIRSSRCHWCRY